MGIIIPGEKVRGTFIARPNRFIAEVLVNGEVVIAHVPNTGRMSELLFPGTEVILSVSKEKPDTPNNKKRKTGYTLLYVKKKGRWIFIHSALANRVFESGISEGKIDWLYDDTFSINIHREVTYGESRLDFLVEGKSKTLIEVKCGTYEEDSIVMFPDAPTTRGQRHIEELIKAKEEGFDAAIVIIAFIDYAKSFTPNEKIDPKFAKLLKKASVSGVDIRAYRCKIDPNEISIDKEIDVIL